MAVESLTEQMAASAAGLTIADIPDTVREKAKLHIMDTLGCGIAGASSSLARQMLGYLRLEHAEGPCAIIGSDLRFGPAAAAFGNGVAMNALDYDDCVEIEGKGMGHPGATIVAAAVSGAFAHHCSGTAFLSAVVAAYEFNNRFIRAMQPSVERFRQVYGVCQHQSVAAAIAFGKLSKLDAVSLENAMGLAGTLANVPSLRKYNWERRPLVSFKDFNGPTAEAGVRAVQLDACGVVGARRVLDGDTGLWRMLGSDQFDAESMTADLSSRWAVLDSGFKAYPACRWLHTAIEAFRTVLAEHEWPPREIEAVTVYTSAAVARDCMDYRPVNMVDAQFSLPFAFAAVAYEIRHAAWFDDATMARDDLRRFGQRVRAEVDPEIDARMSRPERRFLARVSVQAGGRTVSSDTVAFPRGSLQSPLTVEEVRRKFLENAGPVLGAGVAETVVERLGRIEGEENVSSLLDLMRRPTACAPHRFP